MPLPPEPYTYMQHRAAKVSADLPAEGRNNRRDAEKQNLTSGKIGIILFSYEALVLPGLKSEYGTSPCGCNPAKTRDGQEAAKNEAGRNADTNGAVRVSPFRNGVDRWMKVRHCGFGHEKVGVWAQRA